MKISDNIKCTIFEKMIIAVFSICVIAVFIFFKTYSDSAEAYRLGKDFYEKKDFVRATSYFDRALHFYVPFNKYVYNSAEYLWEIHLNRKMNNDTRMSIITLETIRSGFYSASSFYQPGIDWIKKCDSEIAKIKIDLGKSSLKLKDDLVSKTIVSHNNFKRPALFWTLAMLTGLFGWILLFVRYILYSLGSINDKQPFKLDYHRLITVLLLYGLWILGMIKA